MYTTNDNIAFFPEQLIVLDLNKLSYERSSLLAKRIEPINVHYKLQNIREELSKYLDINHINISKLYPTSTGISITNECQLRCTYCAYESGNNPSEVLSREDIISYIDFIFKNAEIRRKCKISNENVKFYFTGGGEPTLAWDTLEFCAKYIKDKSQRLNITVELGLTTNGMITRNQVEFIIKYFDSILVSFDGLPRLQEKNRKTCIGKNSFEYVHNTLLLLNSSNVDFRIRSTVWSEDFSLLIEMFDYIFYNYPNISRWEIEPVTPSGRATINTSKNFIDYSFADRYIELKEYAIERGYGKHIICSMFSSSKRLKNCATMYGLHPWLNSNGCIISCLDAKENSAKLGLVKNANIQFFKTSDNLADNFINDKQTQCNNCFASFFCGGGCPLKHRLDKDNTYSAIPKWECDMKRYYWNKVFKSISHGVDIVEWHAKKTSFHENAYQLEIRKDI